MKFSDLKIVCYSVINYFFYHDFCFQKLKAKIASLQKVIEGQKIDISDKSATISQLEEKLRTQVSETEQLFLFIIVYARLAQLVKYLTAN